MAEIPQPGTLSLDDALNNLHIAKQLDSKTAVIPNNGSFPVNDSSIIQRTPGDEGSKYDKGYIPTLNQEDYRSENQGTGAQFLNGGVRLLGGSLLKAAQGFSVLSSAIGVGAADSVIGFNNAVEDDSHQKDYLGIQDITDNPVNNLFYGLEDDMKKQFAIYKPSEWDTKSLGQQMSSTAWWMDEGVDTLSFALSNLLPAGQLAELGLGEKIASGLAQTADDVVNLGAKVGKAGGLGKYANELLMAKAGLTNPVGLAKGIDALAQNAYMTTSEAYFMSRDAGKTVTDNYLRQKGKQDVSELIPEEATDLNAKKAQSEKYTFWSNMAALSLTSHIEAGLVNKFFGHADPAALGGLVNLGTGIADDAAPAAQRGLQKFLSSPAGSFATNIPKFAITEGLYKANVQNAIQSITTQFGYTGKLDYLKQVAQKSLDNLSDADAWKALMPNLLVGTIMGAIGGAKEVGEQQHAISRAVENINNSKENFINLKNVLYQKDAQGNIAVDNTGQPVYDIPAILDYASNTHQATDLTSIHDAVKNAGNDHIAKVIKDELFTKYALSHLEAGLGDEFIAKTKALNSYKDEDLAKLGFDPIEIGPDGNKVTISQKSQELTRKATEIQKDYNTATKTIGYENYFKTGNKTADAIQNSNLQNSRINEAVKIQSRIRSLDELTKDAKRSITNLQAKQIQNGGNPLVDSINLQARQLEAQKNSFAEGLRIGNINPDSRQANEIASQIQTREEAIRQTKEASREELEKIGYEVTSDASELRDEKPLSPDDLEMKDHLQNIEDSSVSKLGLQDRYNKITDYNNGADNFVRGIQEKSATDIDEANVTDDANNTTDQQLSQYKEGDFLEYGDKRGYVTPDANGNLTVNGNVLSKAFIDQNTDLRKYSPEELQSYKDSQLKDFRRGQLQDRINKVQSRIDSLLKRDSDKQEQILNHLISIDELVPNKENGISRVSERKLARQISSVQDTINQLSQEREELLNQIDNFQSKIEDLKDDQQNGDINDNYEQLDTYNKDLDSIHQAIQQNNTWIDKLQNALKTFQELWRKFFPNKVLNLEKGRKDYTDAKSEIQLTKEQIKDLENTNSDLLEIKKGIEARIKFLEDETKEYELQASKLDYSPSSSVPEVTITNETTITNPPTVNSSPIPAIEDGGLFKTVGAHSRDGKLNEKFSQRIWGDFANKFDPKNTEGQHFRTVSINDPEYGLKGSKNDLFSEEDIKYQHKDNIKVLVVDKDNNPIYHNGSLVYTSLPEITDSKTKASDFTNFRSVNEELARQTIEDYRDFANTIKNSKEPLKLQITGKSNGRIVVGEPISAKEAFGKDLPLQIITDDKTTIGGSDYPLPKGLVYVNYNGRPVGAETRTLTPLESQAVLSKLKEYGQLRGDKDSPNNGELLNQIKGTILLNQRTNNPDFDIYFVKGKDELIFGDKIISTKDLIDGTYDTQLREFLDNQNLQVDKSTLDKNQPYTDIFDKKWNSYSNYLLTPRENIQDTPLTFKIVPLSDDINKPQFLNTYLTYSKPKNEVIDSKPQEVTSTTQANAFEFGTSMPFISMSSILDAPIQSLEEVIAPKEEVVKAIEKETDKTIQTDLLDDLYLHKDIVSNYSPIDFEKEEKFFRENISSTLPFERVKGLIDKQAYGKFTNAGSVLISDIATEGTGYHEAFHVVSQLYLTDKEREGLYNQWKTNNKDTESTNNQVEEKLAEEFREYMLTKQSSYKSFFDKIKNFIKGLLGINNSDRDTLFSRIFNGYFKDSGIKSNTDLNLYRMSNTLDASTTKDLLDSMTLTLVRGLFKNNFSLNDIERFNNGLLEAQDSSRFSNLYDNVLGTISSRMLEAAEKQSNGDHLRNVVKYINDNKAQVQLDHVKYLTKYGINLEVEPDTNLPEDYQKAKDTLGIISSVEFSAKSGMPNVIKLMIASLPKLSIDANGKKIPSLNNLGLPKLSDYRRNTAILQNELSGISDFSEQMKKVANLSTRIPEFSLLADQLGISEGQITPSNLRGDYFDLQSKFRQQFDKAYYNFYTQLYDGNNSYILDSNSDRLSSTIKTRWQGDAFTNKNAYKTVQGQYILDSNYFKKTYDKSLKGEAKAKSVLSFYKDLGITFSQPGLVDIDVLADKQKALISKMEENDISSIFQDEAESKGFVNSLVEQELKTSLDYSDNQHINPEGKTVYNVSLHNYLTRLTAEINIHGLPQELSWNEETQQGNPLLRHSSWADKIRAGKKLSVGILEGARVDAPGETGTSTSDLSYPDAASLQFTSVLNGNFPYMRAGDKALENSFSFGESPKYTSLEDTTNYFKGHLSDELLSSYMLNVEGIGVDYPEYANSAKDLRIFKDAFNEEDTKAYQAIINNKTTDRKEAINRIDLFADKDSVKASLQDWLGKYTKENLGLLEEQNLIFKNVDDTYSLLGIPSELAEKFVGKSDKLSIGQMNSLVEQFTINQLQSNIEQTKMFTGDVAFYKDFFKRTSGLTGTGKTTWTGSAIDTWLNKNRKREYQSYGGSIKVDKQSDSKIQSLMFNDVKAVSTNFKDYVENLVEKGLNREYANSILDKYNKAYDEGDAQGYITLPEYREFLTRTGDWTASHEALYPKLIRGEQISAEDLGNFLSGYAVLKPQYFGKQTDPSLFVPTFYKFSAMPLIPSVVKGTELEELMHTMLENGHGLAVFKTANKVGAKAGNNLYDESGKINLDAKNLIQQELDYASMKIQLDINPHTKSKVIFGTQFRKLVLANLAGKTLTINGKTIEGNRMIKSYTDLINKTVELETKNLIDKLGLKDAGNNQFRLEKPEYLRNLLTDEAFSRQAPDNLLEGIKQVLPEEGGHRQFDVLVNRNKIENILMSLVNNSVIKQKTFGDMRVQGSSTGFEAKTGLKGRGIADAEKSTWWSQVEHVGEPQSGLSFYKADPSGTQPMEIYLPHYFKDFIGTKDERPANVDYSRLDERLTKIIGYRTPTQGLNSMELMKIKGFLPQEAGNLIVVPSEIVVKSGSDFDIDKLSLHFPNYEMVDGEPKYLEYKGNEESLPHIYNRINDLAWKTIAAPENFRQLITPNSNGPVEEIANEVAKMKEKTISPTDNGKGNNIGWKKNLDIRQAYLSGKEGIGIAAIHNTNHVLNQIVGLKAKPEVKIYLDHNEDTGRIDFSKEREVGADPINSPTILDNLSAFLNGLVDMANNPFLSTINTTIDTLPTYLYLVKAGVPIRQAIMFMNQPIISDYLKQSQANDSLGLKATDNKLGEETLIKKVLDKYSTNQAKLDLSKPEVVDNYKKTITTSKLEEYIKGNPNNAVQQQILLDYLSYKDGADGLSDLIKATTADTRGTGATMNSAQNVIDNFNKLKENSIFENVESYMKQTFIGSFHDAVTKSVELYKPVFYTERAEVKQELSRIKDQLQLSKFADTEKAMNLAKNDIINFVIQSTPIEGITIKNSVRDLYTGEDSLAKILSLAKEHKDYRDNPIIRELFPLVSSNSTNEISDAKALDNIKMFSKKLEAADSNLVTEGWKDLFNLNPQFAQNLMVFTMMQSGLNNSPVSFTQYVPNEHFVPLASRLLQNKDVDFKDFYEKFMSNNYQNDDLVPKTKRSIKTQNGIVTIADGNTAKITPPRRSLITGKLLGQDLTQYSHIKAWNNQLQSYEFYRNTGELTNFNGRDAVLFERAAKRGDGYNLKEWTDESAILSNRITQNFQSNKVLQTTNELRDLRENFKDNDNKPIC